MRTFFYQNRGNNSPTATTLQTEIKPLAYFDHIIKICLITLLCYAELTVKRSLDRKFRSPKHNKCVVVRK